MYEASFLADDIFVSIDILERRKRGFILTEVKSTLDIKEQHLADVAIQVHVVRRAGLVVDRAEVMHLNRECRQPRLTNLFVRRAVTRRIGPLLRAIPTQAPSMLSMLAGGLPEVPTGGHCAKPYPCPLESDLAKIRDRLRDLLPIVRDHVYHPAFQGSFSIKSALPALVPGFGYEDLEIQEGATASAALEGMLLGSDALTDIERKNVQRDLLEYCKRDTLAMVRLHERLLEIA
jgi:hypothetical protein